MISEPLQLWHYFNTSETTARVSCFPYLSSYLLTVVERCSDFVHVFLWKAIPKLFLFFSTVQRPDHFVNS